jgi:hypothetical protein
MLQPLNEIQALKARIKALEEEEDWCENEYEDLLLRNPEVVHNAVMDMNAVKIDQIRATSVKDIEHILKYFEGTSLTKKRQALTRFLQSFPAFKTNDPNLLAKRLKRLRISAREYKQRRADDTMFWRNLRATGFIIE